MWNSDRTKYYGTLIPTEMERVTLEAHARLHWLRIETRQNLAKIANIDALNARVGDGG